MAFCNATLPCTAPAFCHGTFNPTCETISYSQMTSMQCSSFVTLNASLTTLALAEQACSSSPDCSAVSDLYCNGMFNSADYYVLCTGGGHVTSSSACVWEKPAGV